MKSLKVNFFYSIGYQLLVIFIPLITAPYITRTIGQGLLGEYSYTHSVATYFCLLAMLGISQHGNREIAESRDNRQECSKKFWTIYSIQFIMHTVIITLYIFYVILFANGKSISSWLQLIYIFSSLFDISWLFFGVEDFKITILKNILIKTLTVFLIFSFVKSDSDFILYVVIMTMGMLINQLYLWVYLKRYIDFTPISLNYLISHIRPILTLFVPVLAYSIYKVMDKIMIGIMSNYEEVALYDYAYKINNIPIGIITAVGNVMLPRITYLINKKDNKSTNRYFEISFYFINFISAALVFGIGAVSKCFAVVYYGVEYEKCGSLMVILNWTVFFIAWANIMRTQYLIPMHKDKIYVCSTIFGALINLIINFCLIPRYNSAGAAVGTFMAEFSVMFYQLIFVNREKNVVKYIFNSIPFFILGMTMMITVRIISRYIGIGLKQLLIEIICGAGIYIVGSLIIIKSNRQFLYNDLFKIVRK